MKRMNLQVSKPTAKLGESFDAAMERVVQKINGDIRLPHAELRKVPDADTYLSRGFDLSDGLAAHLNSICCDESSIVLRFPQTPTGAMSDEAAIIFEVLITELVAMSEEASVPAVQVLGSIPDSDPDACASPKETLYVQGFTYTQKGGYIRTS